METDALLSSEATKPKAHYGSTKIAVGLCLGFTLVLGVIIALGLTVGFCESAVTPCFVTDVATSQSGARLNFTFDGPVDVESELLVRPSYLVDALERDFVPVLANPQPVMLGTVPKTNNLLTLLISPPGNVIGQFRKLGFECACGVAPDDRMERALPASLLALVSTSPTSYNQTIPAPVNSLQFSLLNSTEDATPLPLIASLPDEANSTEFQIRPLGSVFLSDSLSLMTSIQVMNYSDVRANPEDLQNRLQAAVSETDGSLIRFGMAEVAVDALVNVTADGLMQLRQQTEKEMNETMAVEWPFGVRGWITDTNDQNFIYAYLHGNETCLARVQPKFVMDPSQYTFLSDAAKAVWVKEQDKCINVGLPQTVEQSPLTFVKDDLLNLYMVALVPAKGNVIRIYYAKRALGPWTDEDSLDIITDKDARLTSAHLHPELAESHTDANSVYVVTYGTLISNPDDGDDLPGFASVKFSVPM